MAHIDLYQHAAPTTPMGVRVIGSNDCMRLEFRRGGDVLNLWVDPQFLGGFAANLRRAADELALRCPGQPGQEGGGSPIADLPPVPGGGGMAATGGEDGE